MVIRPDPPGRRAAAEKHGTPQKLVYHSGHRTCRRGGRTKSSLEERLMTMDVQGLKVGMQVPDFDLTCYDPRANDFTKVALADLKKNGKWTILFFYPADFTFV
jgi:hypothetical protein